MSTFLKFGALSGGGWLLDCGILLLLSQVFAVPVPISNFVSSSTAAVLVFTASRLMIFASAREQPLRKTALYFLYICVVITIASIVIIPIVEFIQFASKHFNFNLSTGKVAFLAKVIITPPQLLANFLVSKSLSRANF